MLRVAAVFVLLCSACVFDAGVSLDEDGVGEDPGATDPNDPTNPDVENDPDAQDPPTGVCPSQVVLTAMREYDPFPSFVDGEVELSPPYTFGLPREIEVVLGASGDHCAFLDVHLAGQDPVRCAFRGNTEGGGGGGNNGGFHGFDDGAGGSFGGIEYDLRECRSGPNARFEFCSDDDSNGQRLDYQDGDLVTADRLVLSIDDGDSDKGMTQVELQLSGTCD